MEVRGPRESCRVSGLSLLLSLSLSLSLSISFSLAKWLCSIQHSKKRGPAWTARMGVVVLSFGGSRLCFPLRG